MRRLTLATIATLLAVPASALAGSTSGTVLSVDGRHHKIEVVDASHLVHAYHYRGRLPRLRSGSRISFQLSSTAIGKVKLLAHAPHSVSFYARVVRSSRRSVVLKLADGRSLSLSDKQLRGRSANGAHHRRHSVHAQMAAGAITIKIQGLEPGVTVLVTETFDDQGNITITISLPRGSAPGAGARQNASGVVTEVDQDAFTVQTDDGSQLRLHMAADQLSNLGLQVCDTVDVSYHQDAAILVADGVNDTGSSTDGDCADQQGSQGQDVVGTITQVSADSVTVDAQDQGSMAFAVSSPDVTDGFQVGDVVDVTYTDNGDGTLQADDVEYDEHDATGTVTAVSDGSLTFTDGDSGQPVTVTADPAAGLFDGISVGDQVEVNYHQSAGGLVADGVDQAT